MNIKTLVCATGLALCAATMGSAATLVSQFTFDSDLSDTVSGATATGAGTVSGGSYSFAANQGLFVSMDTGLSTYSVVFDVALNTTSGYRKLMDVSGLTSDNGLYNLSGRLTYYSATSASGTITANQNATIILTFDGTTTVGYVDGVQAFSFAVAGVGYPGTLTNFTLVEDDTATGKFEASAGSIDFLEVYDGVLSASDIAAYDGPASLTPVPLPAGGALLLAGLGAFGALRARRRTV